MERYLKQWWPISTTHGLNGYCCCLRLCVHVPVCASIPSSFYLSRSSEFCSPVQCCWADTSAWKVRIHQPEHWFSGEKTSRVGARQCSTAVSRSSTGWTHWPLENVASIIWNSVQNNSLSIHHESALRRTPHKLINERSALVQVMAWYRQAASHYLSQCRPRCMFPYGVTRPQWVETLRPTQNGYNFVDDIIKCSLLNENNCIMIAYDLCTSKWASHITVI